MITIFAAAAVLGGGGQGQDPRFDLQFAIPQATAPVAVTSPSPLGALTTAPSSAFDVSAPASISFSFGQAAAGTSQSGQKTSAEDEKRAQEAWKKAQEEIRKAEAEFKKAMESAEFKNSPQAQDEMRRAQAEFKKAMDQAASAGQMRFDGQDMTVRLAPLANLAQTRQVLVGGYSKEEQKKVSVSFNSAPAKEVLEWLKQQGVSFIVEDSRVEGSRKVTMNVSNVPLGAVADSLASALGGHWEFNNGIRVYQAGRSPFAMTYTTPNATWSRVTPHIAVPARPNPKVYGDTRIVTPPRTFTFGHPDIKSFIDSLTSEQKAKQEKQGYLKVSDLTAGQRKALGLMDTKGKVEFTFSNDGKKVVIKSD